MPENSTTKSQSFHTWFVFVLRVMLSHARAVEASLIALALWWAFILILPFDTFSTSSSYDGMAKLAPEWVWSIIILGIGGTHLYGMAKSHIRLRMCGLLMAMGLWMFIATVFAISNLASTAAGTYGIISFLNGYIYVKVGEFNGRKCNRCDS